MVRVRKVEKRMGRVTESERRGAFVKSGGIDQSNFRLEEGVTRYNERFFEEKRIDALKNGGNRFLMGERQMKNLGPAGRLAW